MCDLIKDKISDNQLINKLSVVKLAIKNNLFKDYSPDHLLARQDNFVLNLTTNLFYRLETLRRKCENDFISKTRSECIGVYYG